MNHEGAFEPRSGKQLESIFGVSWSGHVLVVLYTEEMKTAPDDIRERISSSLQNRTDNEKQVDNGIIIASFTLYSLWLLSAILLLLGSYTKSKALLLMWILMTILINLSSCAGIGYYGFRLQTNILSEVRQGAQLSMEMINKNFAIFYYLVCFTIGAINFPFNICFAVLVGKHITEIKKNKVQEIKQTHHLPTPPSLHQNRIQYDDDRQHSYFDLPDYGSHPKSDHCSPRRLGGHKRETRPFNYQYRRKDTQMVSFQRDEHSGPEQAYDPRHHYQKPYQNPEYNFSCRYQKPNPDLHCSSRPFCDSSNLHVEYESRSQYGRPNLEPDYDPRGWNNQGFIADSENDQQNAPRGNPWIRH
ncbi:uncharacterized protein LOC111085605 isoform X2 [Limulus polyphemus]|uniref:Uncharacterized protein LOC111085605 isoform X2 n=1 Tax=Limulus polyphemus TaxID=6850 RepID=A0ABM1SAP7_LIMPO|nr:uncharacterized protein LOC111085605 isoform X2 [Limulus polyphemus]